MADLQTVQQQILRSPFHRWLDLRVTDLTERTITIEAPWRDEWVSNPDAGTAHGGIVAALLDLAADWALVGTIGHAVPTVDLRVDYLRPALRGTLTATGTVLRPGRQVSAAEAVLTGADGRTVALARGTYLSGASA